MRTYCKISVVVLLALFFASCGNTQSNSSIAKATEGNPDTTFYGPVSHWDTIYTYICDSGYTRVFCDVYGSWYHHLFVSNENASKDVDLVELVYHRYDSTNFLEDGNPCAFSYTISPDGENLYLVTRVFANSNGWTTEYQLFKVNCETLEAKFICDCAAMAVTENGFTVAQARLTNRDEATCNAEQIYVMHDEFLDWDGNVLRVSNEEYDYDMMDVKYLNDDDSYLKGFKI